MELPQAIKEKKMDLRLRNKLIHEGSISKVEMDKFLDSLPDDSENMMYTSDTKKKQEEEQEVEQEQTNS